MSSKRKSTKRKTVGKTDLVAIGAAVASGESRRDILAKHPEAPERLVRELQRFGLGVEEFRSKVIADAQSAASETLSSYREDLRQGEVSPNSKAIAFGILLDKIGSLSGAATMRSIDVSVSINAYSPERSKEEILATLWPKAEAIPLLDGNGDSPESVFPVTRGK